MKNPKTPDGSLNPINQAIVTFDSHSYTDGDYFGIAWKYDNIHQCQIDWYATEMESLKAKNNGVEVNNLVFFHIPLREYRDAWANVIESGKSKDELTKGTTISSEKGTTEFIYGTMGESDKKKNGVRTYGVFCGHDHYNNFSVNYTPNGASRSIRLTYGMSIDYLAYAGIYKENSQRGTTVISIKSDGTFDCAAKNYYEDFEGANDYVANHQ